MLSDMINHFVFFCFVFITSDEKRVTIDIHVRWLTIKLQIKQIDLRSHNLVGPFCELHILEQGILSGLFIYKWQKNIKKLIIIKQIENKKLKRKQKVVKILYINR